MMGGYRPKWTKLAANFPQISEMNVECDNSHAHLPWGKALNDEGKEVVCHQFGSSVSTKVLLLFGTVHYPAVAALEHEGFAGIVV